MRAYCTTAAAHLAAGRTAAWGTLYAAAHAAGDIAVCRRLTADATRGQQ